MSHPLINEARKYIGCPFRHRGRGPKYFDCAGLAIRALNDIGFVTKDLKIYGREPHKDGLRDIVIENLGPPVSDMSVGDIVLIKFHTEPHHIGLIGDYLYGGFSLIHSYAEVGKVVEHRLDDAWSARILEVYRIPA